MPQIGAEIDAMQVLQATFTRESGSVEQLTQAIGGQLGNTWWVGPAAERFTGEWESQFRPMLAQLQTALQECSSEVQRRAQAITTAGS